MVSDVCGLCSSMGPWLGMFLRVCGEQFFLSVVQMAVTVYETDNERVPKSARHVQNVSACKVCSECRCNIAFSFLLFRIGGGS